MSELQCFVEAIEAAGTPIEPKWNAYRMDGTSGMRAQAGLGTCNCCDYFVLGKTGTVILIEETQLALQLGRFAREHGRVSLSPEESRARILRSVKHENRLKVYGSLLVLCRLARCLTSEADARALSQTADFWLVASGELDGDGARVLDYLRDDLYRDLRSVLKAVVGDVQIIPAAELGKKLSRHSVQVTS